LFSTRHPKEHERKGLPSWVPDWSHSPRHRDLPDCPSEWKIFRAESSFRAALDTVPILQDQGGNLMTLSGFILDEVKALARAYPESDGLKLQRAMHNFGLQSGAKNTMLAFYRMCREICKFPLVEARSRVLFDRHVATTFAAGDATDDACWKTLTTYDFERLQGSLGAGGQPWGGDVSEDRFRQLYALYKKDSTILRLFVHTCLCWASHIVIFLAILWLYNANGRPARALGNAASKSLAFGVPEAGLDKIRLLCKPPGDNVSRRQDRNSSRRCSTICSPAVRQLLHPGW